MIYVCEIDPNYDGGENWLLNFSKINKGMIVYLPKLGTFAKVEKIENKDQKYVDVTLSINGKKETWISSPEGLGFDGSSIINPIFYFPDEYLINSDQELKAEISFLRNRLQQIECSLDIKDLIE